MVSGQGGMSGLSSEHTGTASSSSISMAHSRMTSVEKVRTEGYRDSLLVRGLDPA